MHGGRPLDNEVAYRWPAAAWYGGEIAPNFHSSRESLEGGQRPRVAVGGLGVFEHQLANWRVRVNRII